MRSCQRCAFHRDRDERFASEVREAQQRRALVVRVRFDRDQVFGVEYVGDALDRLARDAQPVRDPRDGPITVAEHAEHLPTCLRLTGHGGDPIAVAADRTGRLKQIRDQQRQLVLPGPRQLDSSSAVIARSRS